MHFSSYATKVTMVIRGAGLKETLSQYLVDRILAAPNVEVMPRTEVTALHGDGLLRAITLTNNQTGQDRMAETQWLFLCLGGVPHTDWAIEARVSRDSAGYILTGPDLLADGKYPKNWPLERAPYYLETSVPGLFAAGDVQARFHQALCLRRRRRRYGRHVRPSVFIRGVRRKL